MPRYVILHHTGAPEGDHFDFMLERGGALKTWRIATPDLSTLQPAEPIQDHRLDYLTLEGEVSGGRGRVTRVASGDYAESWWTDDEVSIRIEPRGVILIRAGLRWVLAPLSL